MPLEGSAVRYDDFKTILREAAARPDTSGLGLLSVPALRRRVVDQIGREAFDDYVMEMHREGLVHLLSHVDTEHLPEADKRDCLTHPSGWLVYWVRWL